MTNTIAAIPSKFHGRIQSPHGVTFWNFTDQHRGFAISSWRYVLHRRVSDDSSRRGDIGWTRFVSFISFHIQKFVSPSLTRSVIVWTNKNKNEIPGELKTHRIFRRLFNRLLLFSGSVPICACCDIWELDEFVDLNSSENFRVMNVEFWCGSSRQRIRRRRIPTRWRRCRTWLSGILSNVPILLLSLPIPLQIHYVMEVCRRWWVKIARLVEGSGRFNKKGKKGRRKKKFWKLERERKLWIVSSCSYIELCYESAFW